MTASSAIPKLSEPQRENGRKRRGIRDPLRTAGETEAHGRKRFLQGHLISRPGVERGCCVPPPATLARRPVKDPRGCPVQGAVGDSFVTEGW